MGKEFYPQIEATVRSRCPGATRVLILDHILRAPERLAKETADGPKPATPFLQGRLGNVHCDYTHRSGHSRARQLLEPFASGEELDKALEQRFAIVNFWYPFKKVFSDPLAMATWDSMSP